MNIKSRQCFQTTPARFIEYSSETCSQPQIRIAEQLRDTNLIIIACTLSHANFALDAGRAFTKTLLIATLYHSRRKRKANCAFVLCVQSLKCAIWFNCAERSWEMDWKCVAFGKHYATRVFGTSIDFKPLRLSMAKSLSRLIKIVVTHLSYTTWALCSSMPFCWLVRVNSLAATDERCCALHRHGSCLSR